MSPEYNQGYESRIKGYPKSDCPFPMPKPIIEGLGYGQGHNEKIINRFQWLGGWNDADMDIGNE